MSCREILMNNLSNRFFRLWSMLLLVLAAGSGRVLAAGTWGATDPMEYDRYWFTATSLLSGQVLVTGGFIFRDYQLSSPRTFDRTNAHFAGAGPERGARDKINP